MGSQTATILVTDVVGSTELRARLGEDAAEELRRSHDRMLAEVASGNGGTIVKGLGDGVLVTFPGAAEAVGSAIGMQQAIDALGRRNRVELAIRVGVSSGDVTFEEGDCFGTPVVEASRLCASAQPGQILVADVVRVLARGRGGHAIEPVGSLDLKGLPEAVVAHEVRWEAARHVADVRGQLPYAGRAVERETLGHGIGAALEGRGGLVLVCGEPGIGKTRLVEEVCTEVARPAGFTVITGGCHDGEVLPHAPFVEGLTGWVRNAPAAVVDEVLGRQAPVIARLVPAVLEVLPNISEPLPVPPEAAAARLHDAVGQVVERMSSVDPVMLVLDDLHWADDATISLLRVVARAARSLRVLVVGTYRETDLSRRHPLANALPLLRREVEPVRIALDGLDVAAVHSLLEQVADHEVPESFALLLAEQTEGNPFFLRETLLHLVEEGRIRFEEGRWTTDAGDLGIPEGVREVIGRRLSRLSDNANALLSVGALFEVSFPLLVAAEVAGLGEVDALDAIDEALDARIVRPTDEFDRYAFTHALFRQTLSGELNPSRQVRMHRAIADHLEKQLADRPPSAGEAAVLVRHFERSSALPGAERGVPYARLVADDAAVRAAPQEALDALTVARELLPEGDERAVDVQQGIAEATVFARRPADEQVREAAELGALVEAEEATEAACDAVTAVAIASSSFDDREATWRLGAVARRWLDPQRRDSTWLALRAWELEEADFRDPDHPGVPLDTPERRELFAAAEQLAVPMVPGTVNRFGTRASAAAIASLGTPSPAERAMAAWYLGDMESSYRFLLQALDHTQAQGWVAPELLTRAILARLAAVLGRHDEADEHLAAGGALTGRVDAMSNPVFQLIAANSLVRTVRGEILEPLDVAGFEEFVTRPGTKWAGLATLLAAARTHAFVGAVDESMSVLGRSIAPIQRAGAWAPNYPLIVSYAVDILWALERTDHVDVLEHTLRGKVLDLDFRYMEVDSRGDLARLCALTGRVEEARHWFAEGRRILAEQGTTTLAVRVDHDEALMELRRGAAADWTRISECVSAARAGASHGAMAAWHDRLDILEDRSPRASSREDAEGTS